MHRKIVSLATMFTLLIMLPATAQVAPDVQKIADAKAGKIKEAKTSWWGFDPKDSTAQLQAAINSGVPKLIVDKMSGPWIVRPIKLVGNQTIIFEKGVEILAKRGEFKGTGDSLFTARNCNNLALIGYGATFRMWRGDYDNPKLYEHGEWRMCLRLDGCSNVKVYGLTLTESGGDGIYLGTGNGPNENVHIKDVVCDKNYRQGISVINAKNLLIENCILSNTKGTPPAAGIDFEPNHPDEHIANCVLRNCIIKNNAGDGIDMYLPILDANSAKISLQFDNCKVINHPCSVSLTIGGRGVGAPDGSVEFKNCVFEKSAATAINISKPFNRARCQFDNCVIRDYGAKWRASPVIFKSQRKAHVPVGGVEFRNCLIENATANNPMQLFDHGAVGLKNVSGTLIIKTGNKKKMFNITEKLLSQWMQIKPDFAEVPYQKLNAAVLHPLKSDTNSQAFNFGFARVRSFGRFIVYADKDDKVIFTVKHFQVGKYRGGTIPVIISDVSGKEIYRGAALFKKKSQIAFTAPHSGTYYITIKPSGNGVQIINCNHPINLICPSTLIQADGDYYFFVPAETRKFALWVGGSSSAETIRALLVNPDGKIVDKVDNLASAYQFYVELPKNHKGQIWCLRLRKPTNNAWEDHFVNLLGIPPILAPSKEALLVPVE